MNLVELYETVTRSISDETGASDSLVHVHAGMAVLLIARLLTGKSLATPVPFLVVCVAALANEVMDRINHGFWRPVDAGLDILNTVFWPFVLMIGLRIRRSRDARKVLQQTSHPEARL